MMKILVGCPLVPHKTVIFDYFIKSLLDQTVTEYDLIFIWGDRKRGENIKTEDKLRVTDIHNKMCKLWDLFRANDYDYFWNVASDTWYPPQSLETLLRFMKENNLAMTWQVCYNRYKRGFGHQAKDLEEYKLIGTGSYLFDKRARDAIYPRIDLSSTINPRTGANFYCPDLKNAKLKYLLATPETTDYIIPAWHLYHDNDVDDKKERKIRGGIPDFIKKHAPKWSE